MDFSSVLSSRQYITQTAYLATCSTLTGLGAIFVILRLGASFKQAGKPYLDDYASILGLLLLIATFILTQRLQVLWEALTQAFMTEFIKNPTTDFNRLLTPTIEAEIQVVLKTWVAAIVISNLSTWMTKLPILLLLHRLFKVKAWLRNAAYAIIIISLLATIGITIWSGHLCDVSDNLTLDTGLKCSSESVKGHLASGFVGLAVDIAIFILPIPVILNLKLAPKKKIGVIMIFGTAILGIIVSIIGCYWRYVSLSGGFGERQVSILCVVLEGVIAILVGCMPGYYYVWRHVITKSSLKSTYPSASGSPRNITATQKVSQLSGTGKSSRWDPYGDTADYIQMGTPLRAQQGSISEEYLHGPCTVHVSRVAV